MSKILHLQNLFSIDYSMVMKLTASVFEEFESTEMVYDFEYISI